MREHLLTTAGVTLGALLPIVDPLGALPVFHALGRRMTPRQRLAEARRSVLAMFALLVGFLFVGRFVLDFFGISLAALEIAGGLVVGYAGWLMLQGDHGVAEDADGADGEPRSIAFTPMAMPLLAGPGALGVTLGLASRHDHELDYVGNVLGITAMCALTLLVLRFGDRPMRALGPRGIDAVTRIMGLLVLAIGVELVHGGVTDFRR